MKLTEFMTHLFDLRLIGAMLYLSGKLSQSVALFVCVCVVCMTETGRGCEEAVKSTLFIPKDDTFNLDPAK